MYLIPLEQDAVLLPGISQLIPLNGRADVVALLRHLRSMSTSQRDDAPILGCIPRCSRLLGRHGQFLVEGKREIVHGGVVNSSKTVAGEAGLFGYGTVAKVAEVQASNGKDLMLLVEGGSRFRLDELKQSDPFVEGRVSICSDEGKVLVPSYIYSIYRYV